MSTEDTTHSIVGIDGAEPVVCEDGERIETTARAVFLLVEIILLSSFLAVLVLSLLAGTVLHRPRRSPSGRRGFFVPGGTGPIRAFP